MTRYCSPQFSVRTRSSPPYRATIRPNVFHGRNSINCAKRVLPVFTGASLENFQRMLRVQIADTPFCSETGGIRGFQSRDPSVNRTAVNYRPRLTIDASVLLDEQDPLATLFRITNTGPWHLNAISF